MFPKSIPFSREVISVMDTLLFIPPYFYLVEPNCTRQITRSVATQITVIFQKYMQVLNSMDMTSKIQWILVFLWNEFH